MHTDIALSSLRELDAVALATNGKVFMGRDTSWNRTIFHVDMDAFYSSVEQREHPEYRGKAVVVGADPQEGKGRGVVAACSYVARTFGIHSAMPISQAFRLCPTGIYLRPDFKKYTQVSREIRTIFRSFSDLVEPLSIDEAFLDMSHQVKDPATALELAQSLKAEIVQTQHLTSSVGIAPSKFVAKIASDLEKPDGLVLVCLDQVQSFLDPLPISRLWGVGPKTETKLSEMEIRTILQLRHYDKRALVERFGKLGAHLWRLSNGLDDRPVVQNREAKSIGHETTFAEDAWENETLEHALAAIIHKFGVSVDFLRKFRAESVFRCDYKASKLVEPNRDEARAPSGNSSARRGLYICVGAGSQGTVRWDTDGASVMRRAFVRDKTMPGAPRCDEKFPEPGHRF